MKKNKADLWVSVGFMLAFVAWTVGVLLLNVQPIGPESSKVGMAAINGTFHDLTGIHMELYLLTDWLSLIPLAVIVLFGVVGLFQWIKRKQLFKVDEDILALGVFYILVMAVFCFFEAVVVNYRPVLIGGVLEASYPSSTTMLVLTVMPTAIMQLRRRIKRPVLNHALVAISSAYTAFMVLGRLLSGVHWLSDIIGGMFLSASMCFAYRVFLKK